MNPTILSNKTLGDDYPAEEVISAVSLPGGGVLVFRDVIHRNKSGSVAACSQTSVVVPGVALSVDAEGQGSLKRVL